jgi:UDPglucose 6-dehydrogenase
MDITIVGTGYVGLITGVSFAKLGNNVIGLDIDEEKISRINKGIPPIFEENLGEALKDVVGKGFRATADYGEAAEHAELIFISVPTPSSDNGSTDIHFIEEVARSIGNLMSNSSNYKVIIIKSTVPPGTTELVGKIIAETSGKRLGEEFGLAMNPEFLREGLALEDSLNPDRIVIGGHDQRSIDKVKEAYASFKCPIIETDLKTAELIKYASNSLLALKISYSNELGNISKKLGIDVYDVMKGVGLDSRVNPKFLNAGIGYGGSCFPKDVKSLAYVSREMGMEPLLLDAIMKVNDAQPLRLVDMVQSSLGDLKGKAISVLGLAFKPDTDDIREAPSLRILQKLLDLGAKPFVYDPQASDNIRKLFGDKLTYCDSAKDVVSKADIVLILTEWDEFRDPSLYEGKYVFDGRHVLEAKELSKSYEGVCW